MSDVQLLFLVLALLYAWECACWLARGSVAFRTWLGRGWRLAHPGTLLGNQRGGFIFAHPFPPLGTVLSSGPFPFALSPKAILAEDAGSVRPGDGQPQSGRCLLWDQIDSVEARRKKILVNRELLVKAASPILAQQLARLLVELKQAKHAEREKPLRRALRENFDRDRLEARWKEFQAQTQTILWVANALFFYLFVLAPATIWWLGLRSSWLVLLVGLLGLTATSAVLFHRAHKKLYPAAEDERFTHFLIILLSPATTIRARDVLSRPLLEAFHPLALARLFCSNARFENLAQQTLRESRYPAAKPFHASEPLAEETEQYWRSVFGKALEEFLRVSGIDPDKLMRPPAPADPTCLFYCPRCLSQFTTRRGTCEDCGGLALLPLPGAPA